MIIQRPFECLKSSIYRNSLCIKITIIIVLAVITLSFPVFICFSALDVLDDGNAEFDQMKYRGLQIENEVRRGNIVVRLSDKDIMNMLNNDERIFVKDEVTLEQKSYKSDKPPEEIGEIQKRFTQVVIGFLYHHYSDDIKNLKNPLTISVDPHTGYTYANYIRTFKMDKSGHEVLVIVTRNLSSVVMSPLYNFLFTIELVLPWYIITVSIFTFITVSRVFRTLGKGIDSSLAIIEDNNYKGRLEVSERNGREINGIKTKINVVLDRMDNLVNSNIESLQDVSHEVNTHLTAIKQSIYMIKTYGDKNPELAMTKLDTIDENVQRTTAIMTTILELARLDQEVECTSAEEHNVKELIESFVNHYRKVFPDFHFFTEYSCDNQKLHIQKEHFYIGLKPIIENAAKYSSGSPYISITVSGDYSTLSPLYISIKNRGIGIQEKDLPFIFDRNYRGETGGKRGSGLGLAITKKVMDLYNAKIHASSEPGKETIFTLIFPNRIDDIEDSRV